MMVAPNLAAHSIQQQQQQAHCQILVFIHKLHGINLIDLFVDRLKGRWVAIELRNAFIRCPVIYSTDALWIVLRNKHISNNSLQNLYTSHLIIRHVLLNYEYFIQTDIYMCIDFLYKRVNKKLQFQCDLHGGSTSHVNVVCELRYTLWNMVRGL